MALPVQRPDAMKTLSWKCHALVMRDSYATSDAAWRGAGRMTGSQREANEKREERVMSSRTSVKVMLALCVGALMEPVLHVHAADSMGGQAGTIQGPIESLNVAGSRMEVRGQDGRLVTVPIDASTKIRLNGEASTLGALSVGQQATIQQTMRNGQPVATLIEVQPSPSAIGADAGSAGTSAGMGSASSSATESRATGTATR
jgi:hypothetical protein